MKKLKLIDVAPFSGKRVQPFHGVKKYLSTGDLQDKGLSFEEVTFKNKPSRADILVSEGDILFAKMVNTNKVLQIDKTLDGIIVSTGFSIHKPIERVLNGNYLMQFLKTESFNRQKNKLCTGAIQSAISNTGIEKIFIPVPSLFDQIQISNILSKAETIIEQRKQSIVLLDEFLKNTFLEMFGDIVSNKKKWNLLSVAEFSESRLGKMLDRKKIVGNSLKPYLRNTNVLWFGFKLDELMEMDFDERDKKEFSLEYGDVLMCEGGEIGRCAIWKNELKECYFQKAIHRIRLNKKYVLPEFFVFMFWQFTKHGGLKKFMNAATISHLTGEKLKKMKLPIPPLKLQTQFANIVAKTEALKEQYKNSLQELENLFGSISQRAFKGERDFNIKGSIEEELNLGIDEQVVIKLKPGEQGIYGLPDEKEDDTPKIGAEANLDDILNKEDQKDLGKYLKKTRAKVAKTKSPYRKPKDDKLTALARKDSKEWHSLHQMGAYPLPLNGDVLIESCRKKFFKSIFSFNQLNELANTLKMNYEYTEMKEFVFESLNGKSFLEQMFYDSTKQMPDEITKISKQTESLIYFRCK